MTEINMDGYVVLVDDEDVERVKQRQWYIKDNPKINTPYCYTWDYDGITKKVTHTSMHRFILRVTDGAQIVDHIDHNGLNNCKDNLRICSTIENIWNQQKPRDNTSGYKGVSYSAGKWIVRIMKNYVSYYLGAYDDIENAAMAYDIGAMYLHGKYSATNFDKATYKDMDIEKEYLFRVYTPTCKYRGVVKQKEDKYIVHVCAHRKVQHVGIYSSPEEAALAYDKKAYSLLGDKAKLNFPERVEEYKEAMNG